MISPLTFSVIVGGLPLTAVTPVNPNAFVPLSKVFPSITSEEPNHERSPVISKVRYSIKALVFRALNEQFFTRVMDPESVVHRESDENDHTTK